jgi:acetyl-CoA C-acetyltransferase
VGVYEHPARYAPDKSELLIHAECAIQALEDAGLSKKDVDALFTSSAFIPYTPLFLADYLNMQPRYVDSTSVGGASFEYHLSHALTAISAGRINCALITYCTLGRTGGIPIDIGTRHSQGRIDPTPDSFEAPYGMTTVSLYAMLAQRHMHQYGTKPEQLAEIAVAMRKHASMNPSALFRDTISVQDVLRSRMISSPLHLLDCCPVTDGGGAVVIASPELARNCKRRPVWVIGAAEGLAHQGGGTRDMMTLAAAQTGPAALKMAGVIHDNIDMCMIYDSFTITVLMTLEDLGFCKKGEGGAFVSGGRLQIGGDLPTNTDGGGLSSNHPGMRGIFLLIESTKQLRHEYEGTPRQVKDSRIALCHGTGGWIGSRHSGGTAVLARD